MKKIWKFEAPIAGEFHLTMPVGASILQVQVQRDMPCVWVLVDADAPDEVRTFRWVGTGHTVDFIGPYLGTVQVEGDLVFHLFEVIWS